MRKACASWNAAWSSPCSDRKWREHLYEMDYLKDGIGLRGMGQRDPLVEYQREGYQMYNSMIEAIKEEYRPAAFPRRRAAGVQERGSRHRVR